MNFDEYKLYLTLLMYKYDLVFQIGSDYREED